MFPPRNGPVVQLVRTLACHARGQGFESLSGRQNASVAQLVEQGTENPRVVGSIPTGGTTADLAHLVERDLAKVEVAGSSPVIRSIRRHSQAVRQRSAKPSSPVRFRVAPPKEKHPILGCFSFGYAIPPPSDRIPCRLAARNPVRIPAAERDSLAKSRQGVGY